MCMCHIPHAVTASSWAAASKNGGYHWYIYTCNKLEFVTGDSGVVLIIKSMNEHSLYQSLYFSLVLQEQGPGAVYRPEKQTQLCLAGIIL